MFDMGMGANCGGPDMVRGLKWGVDMGGLGMGGGGGADIVRGL